MRVVITNEKTMETTEKRFATVEQAKSYIIGAVHGESVANNLEIPVCELQEQIKNRKGLRLGFQTWTVAE